jgi:SPP1 gp7 family putative phage head morphogenesis protein
VNDNRVRHDHQDREGRQYRWASPPPDGPPGMPINCRCYAEPVFTEILSDLTE